MTLNSRWPSSWLTKTAHSLTRGLTGVALLAGASGITAGCLRRPVAPAEPQTTNVYINQIRQTGVDKIDLLFMIDNSISMADKQQILAEAIPVLVRRLITPACINSTGMYGNQNADGTCQPGYAQEFKPIKNIHIGVITSSLGDHGSHDVCSDEQNQANVAAMMGASDYNDKAQLLPQVRNVTPPLASWDGSGFLVWDPRTQSQVLPEDRHANLTANETDPTAFITAFTNQVTAAGEHGCGYEASLEAWYRFLVDPQPVVGVDKTNPTDPNEPPLTIRPQAVNQAVLDARARFLRQDSLLAIVMMSDENDCSITDEDNTQGWLVGYKGGLNASSLWHMPRSSSACAANPNDKCCRPCIAGPSAGCPDNAADSACSVSTTLTTPEDSMNMRCFNQVRRFGIDLLYPTGRYVEALTSQNIRPRDGGGQVPNPIFTATAGAVPRDPDLIFMAGLVGVPWQDLADDDSLKQGSPSLTYLTATQMGQTMPSRWDVILGANGAAPLDTLMVESIDPRDQAPYPQAHPIVANATIGSHTATTLTNPINGHEQSVNTQRDDLQFACIFKLGMPVKCTPENSDGCDCNSDEAVKNSPLCEGVGDMTDGTQVYAKAYPGARELDVLHGFGKNAIVASICPKNPTTTVKDKATDPNYGYNPAVAAIVERLKEALTVKCLPRPLAPGRQCEQGDTGADCAVPEEVGKVPCAVVEVRPTGEAGCTCDQPGRSLITGERGKIVPAAKEYLKNTGTCGNKGQLSCNEYCYCELNQFTNDQDADTNAQGDLDECKTAQAPANLYGYCYVDPAAAAADGEDPKIIQGEEDLVKTCDASEKRILRFLGDGLPAKDGLAFIACIGAPAAD